MCSLDIRDDILVASTPISTSFLFFHSTEIVAGNAMRTNDPVTSYGIRFFASIDIRFVCLASRYWWDIYRLFDFSISVGESAATRQ